MTLAIERIARLAAPAVSAGLLAGWATDAAAHHMMGGEVPRTLGHGLLSGLGHPVIGLDHFAFVIAIGVIAATSRKDLALVATFTVAALGGTALHVAGLDAPLAEAAIALSLLLAGALIWSARPLAGWLVTALALIAGLAHGYAYGESIVGAEPTPLAAYLAGIAIVQGAIAAAAMLAARRITAGPGAYAAWLPRGGLAVATAGAALLLLKLPMT